MICRTQKKVEAVPKCCSKCLLWLKRVNKKLEVVEVGHWKTWSGWSGSIKNLKWLKWVNKKLEVALKNLKWLKWVNEKLEVVEVGHWKTWSGCSGSMYMKWLSKQLYVMSEYWQNEVNSWSGWSGWSGLQWVLDAPRKCLPRSGKESLSGHQNSTT